MLWLNHPRFVRVREEILQAVQKHEYRFRRTPNVIFLCGGVGSRPRERLAEFLRKKHEEDTLLFYAEEVWIAISRSEELSALEMEAKLAALSDIVIIIVESPGTFAELGAFSLSAELRAKLLPILDQKYRTGKSFLETGPVRWTDKDSAFRPAIWVDHKSILEAAVEIETRLDKILPTPVRVANLAASPKHLLFFVCDLVAIFGPCPAGHIAYYVQRLLGTEEGSVPMFLGLATAMGLLKSFGTAGEGEFFYRPLSHGNLPVFHYTKKHLGIPTLRAKVLSVMETLDVATKVLNGLKETYVAATDG